MQHITKRFAPSKLLVLEAMSFAQLKAALRQTGLDGCDDVTSAVFNTKDHDGTLSMTFVTQHMRDVLKTFGYSGIDRRFKRISMLRSKLPTKRQVVSAKPGTWMEFAWLDGPNDVGLLLDTDEGPGEVSLQVFWPKSGMVNRHATNTQVVHVFKHREAPKAGTR